jgi:thymidylate synthase
LNPAFALAEVIWILRGRDDIQFLEYWNSQIVDYLGEERAHGAYGPRLRETFGLDQLERAYNALRNRPNTRQVVLQIYHPKHDLPNEDGSPSDQDVPCNVSSMLKVRDGCLEWTQVIRSNDLILGVPHNLVQFTSLQEIVAGWLGVDVGQYSQISDSLHVYSQNREVVFDSEPIDVELNTDSLRLSKEESDECFTGLERRAQAFMEERLSRNQHLERSKWPDAPEGIQNILFILSAEAARRRGWESICTEVMDLCSNPLYEQLWNRWFARVTSRTTI